MSSQCMVDRLRAYLRVGEFEDGSAKMLDIHLQKHVLVEDEAMKVGSHLMSSTH